MVYRNLVTHVEVMSSAFISSVLFYNNRQAAVVSSGSWSSVTIRPHAELSIQTKDDSGNTLYNVELTFYTPLDLSDLQRQVFRVTLITGEQMLIGTNERPYTQIQTSEAAPSKPTANQLNKVTVTYSSDRNIPYIM